MRQSTSPTVEHVVVIAASEGAFEPLRWIVAALPRNCSVSMFVVWHIGTHRSILPELLSNAADLPATFAVNDEIIQPGHIYVAPRDRHMILKPGRICLDAGPKVRSCRPAADPLFESAAATYGERVLGIVLSGGDGDGARGLLTIKQHGGTALVQSPADAINPSMPDSAIMADHPDACLPARAIATKVAELAASGR